MSAGGEVFFVEPGIADARDKLPALGIEQESIVEDAVEPELAMQRQQISDQNMKQRNMLQADSDLPASDSEQDDLLAGQRSLGSSECAKKSRAADRSSEQENQPAGAQSVEMSSAGKLKQEKDTPRPSTEPANASELSSEQPRTWQYFLFRIREEAKVEKP